MNLLYKSIVKYYYVHVHIFCFNQVNKKASEEEAKLMKEKDKRENAQEEENVKANENSKENGFIH